MFNSSSPESTSITMHNSKDVPEDDPEDSAREIARVIHVVVRPLLIAFGTTGNILSFLVMRRGSLKTVSTCFYMSILALTDTGKSRFINILIFFKIDNQNPILFPLKVASLVSSHKWTREKCRMGSFVNQITIKATEV